MKFPTQHKDFALTETDMYRVHRDRNRVWVTQDKNTVFQKTFAFVSKAKRWMNAPQFNKTR